MDSLRIDERRLIEFGSRLLMVQGVPEKDARLVAASLVHADAAGQESHGLLRLPWYSKRIASGAIDITTAPEVIADAGALMLVDGHDGIGQVLISEAMERAAHCADRYGIGAVGVRNSNHFGTAGYWTRKLAERGYISILTTNSSPAMAAWGGIEKRIGSNPWSIAVPGGDRGPAVLDMSNSLVARGKIYAAIQNGSSIPEDWALDADGHATTDPHAALGGTLLPIGMYKGYGISFMMDVLSGLFTGSGVATDVVGPYSPTGRSRCGHLMIAIRVASVVDLAEFKTRLDGLIADTVDGPRADSETRIIVPGQREAEAVESAAEDGIRLPQRTVDDLADLAAQLDVEFDLTE